MHARHLSEASPSWKGYTAEQRSTLRALLQKKGIEPAPDKGRPRGKPDSRGAQSGRGDGETSAAGEVVIRDEAAYREQKKTFDRKYREYKQLDAELGGMTATFEALEGKYNGAPAEQQLRIAHELLRTYEEVRRPSADLVSPTASLPPCQTSTRTHSRAHVRTHLLHVSLSLHTHGSSPRMLRCISAQKKSELETKSRTYRRLHLELQSIKQEA